MSGDDRFVKVPEDPSSHPNFFVVGDTGVFWDGYDLPIAGNINPYLVVCNLTEALETSKKLVGFLKVFYYCEDEPVMDDMLEDYNTAGFIRETGYEGGDDQFRKSSRAKSMISGAVIWAGDICTCRDNLPANILIVSDSVSDQPELVSRLKDLKQRGFNILLVQSAEKEALDDDDDDDIPTESFDWLWKCILHGRGSSQGDDICNLCGGDSLFEALTLEDSETDSKKLAGRDENEEAITSVEEIAYRAKEVESHRVEAPVVVLHPPILKLLPYSQRPYDL